MFQGCKSLGYNSTSLPMRNLCIAFQDGCIQQPSPAPCQPPTCIKLHNSNCRVSLCSVTIFHRNHVRGDIYELICTIKASVNMGVTKHSSVSGHTTKTLAQHTGICCINTLPTQSRTELLKFHTE
jgi:hypothetical protein